MSSFVVGVDGGTTKTIALVADHQGRILAATRGAGSNCTTEEVARPMRVVLATVRAALEQAGLTGADVAMAVLGLAGADWPEDYARRQAWLDEGGIARRLVLKNDALVGLRAGSRQPYGVVISAGTGSNTGVIAPDGREFLYGYYVRYGGARDVAREALDAVFREEDGRGQRTTLTALVLGQLGYPRAEALLRGVVSGQVQGERLAGLCPLVFAASDAGDEVAAAIIVRQGLALAEYATAAIRRFGMQRLAFDVVLAGSVFKGQGPLLVDTVTQAIHSVASHARVVRAPFEPAVGGVLLAYDALGVTVTESMYTRLAESMPDEAFFTTLAQGL